MPRIQPVSRENAPATVAATLGAVHAKIGKVPNLIGTFANSPAALNAYLGLSETLGAGRLNAKQREVIALAVAQTNNCAYCLAAHSTIGKGAGLSESDIREARLGNAHDPLTDALAKLASKIVTARGVLSNADIAEARAAGADDGLLIEVVAQVAFNTLTNYTNHLADTVVDFPPAAPL
jgi:uncharacterized peroxidase-related enzyme